MDLNFKVSMESANLIMKWLGKGQFDEVAAVIADLQAQAAPQLAAAQQQQQSGVQVNGSQYPAAPPPPAPEPVA